MERGEAVILRGAHVQLSLAETREKEEHYPNGLDSMETQNYAAKCM